LCTLWFTLPTNKLQSILANKRRGKKPTTMQKCEKNIPAEKKGFTVTKKLSTKVFNSYLMGKSMKNLIWSSYTLLNQKFLIGTLHTPLCLYLSENLDEIDCLSVSIGYSDYYYN